MFAADHGDYGFLGPLDLNILSIRSVITNPPTTLLVAAMIARVPRSVASVLLLFAGQNDGAHDGDRVQCIGQRHQRRVEQGRDAPNHFKADEAASMNTYRLVTRSSFTSIPPSARSARAAARRIRAPECSRLRRPASTGSRG